MGEEIPDVDDSDLRTLIAALAVDAHANDRPSKRGPDQAGYNIIRTHRAIGLFTIDEEKNKAELRAVKVIRKSEDYHDAEQLADVVISTDDLLATADDLRADFKAKIINDW